MQREHCHPDQHFFFPLCRSFNFSLNYSLYGLSAGRVKSERSYLRGVKEALFFPLQAVCWGGGRMEDWRVCARGLWTERKRVNHACKRTGFPLEVGDRGRKCLDLWCPVAGHCSPLHRGSWPADRRGECWRGCKSQGECGLDRHTHKHIQPHTLTVHRADFVQRRADSWVCWQDRAAAEKFGDSFFSFFCLASLLELL